MVDKNFLEEKFDQGGEKRIWRAEYRTMGANILDPTPSQSS